MQLFRDARGAPERFCWFPGILRLFLNSGLYFV